MKLKLNGILVLFVVLIAQLTFAQDRAKGVVSDNGMPIPGVSVLVKGTKLAHKLILTVNMQSMHQSNINFQLRGHENPRIKSDVIVNIDGGNSSRT
jgi:hypothetical protein